MAHNDFSIELIMRTPLRVPGQRDITRLGSPPSLLSPSTNDIPFSSAFLLHVCPTGCAILFHAWNPIAYLAGKIARTAAAAAGGGARQRKKARAFTSVKRLGNCWSAVGRPAKDDAIFEDNASGRGALLRREIVSISIKWNRLVELPLG